MTADEKALIGSVLYDPAAYEVSAHLRPTDFTTAGHALIWEAIQAVAAAGQPIDTATITNQLTTRGEAERAGGSHAVVELATGVFLPGHAAVYAQLIVERSARRRLADAGRWLAAEAMDSDNPALLAARTIEGITAIQESVSARPTGPGRTYRELLALEFTQEWVSPRYLAPGDRLILTGKPGAGKSTLMRQIAVCVAAGLDPFNQQPVPPRRVLVVDCENSDSLNQGKYRSLSFYAQDARGGDPIPDDHLLIESRVDGLDLVSQKDASWLLSVVRANQPDLLVVGPIYKLHTANPNDEEPARRVIAALDRIRATGCALAMEAHANKTNETLEPFGASIWMRWPEFGYGLKQVGDVYDLIGWRGPRDVRSFPTQLVRGRTWPWRDAHAPAVDRYVDPVDLADRAWPQVPPPAAGGGQW